MCEGLRHESIFEIEKKMERFKVVEKIDMAVQPNLLRSSFVDIPKAFICTECKAVQA